MSGTNSECFVIAIDGPAGAGKSTTARRVADALGYAYLDSGALYRAVALAAVEAGVDLDDAAALERLVCGLDIDTGPHGDRLLLAGRDVAGRIRTPEVSQAASKVSAHAGVRTALVALQRASARPPGCVCEGRDMGTVIFPQADLKVFLHADPLERARRRAAELGVGGQERTAVEREMAERDHRDSSREVAPLERAPDAMEIDSTHMGLEEVVDTIVSEARRRAAAK